MKRTEFLFKTSKHHHLPREIEWQLTQNFFRQASTNTRPLMLGAVLFFLAVIFHGANPVYALFWLVVQFVCGLFLHLLISNYQDPVEEKRQLFKFMMARMIIGALISMLFGMSLFLLPEAHFQTGIPTLVFMLMMIAIITVFRYAMLPIYSYVYVASLVFPQLIFFAFNQGDMQRIYLLLIPAGITMLIHLGNTLSESSRETISLNSKLKNEIKEHVKTKKSLEVIAMKDPLTGLGNRRLFDKSVLQELQRYERFNNGFTLFFIDLDKFKPVNDLYGHDVGDKLLIELANRFESSIRVTDTIARIGGDEFAILAPGIIDKESIEGFITKLQSAICAPLQIDKIPLKPQASIGWANCPDDGINKHTLLKNADARMYSQKHKS